MGLPAMSLTPPHSCYSWTCSFSVLSMDDIVGQGYVTARQISYFAWLIHKTCSQEINGLKGPMPDKRCSKKQL